MLFTAGARPLTPFYAEPVGAESDFDVEEDPFDTSHVTHLPGKHELRLIERELDEVSSSPAVFQPIHEKLGVTQVSFHTLRLIPFWHSKVKIFVRG